MGEPATTSSGGSGAWVERVCEDVGAEQARHDGILAPGTMDAMTVDPAVVRASLADATPDVFWTDRPERPAPRAALTGAGHNHRTSSSWVVVFTGLWAAIQAKEDDPSRDVVVLERRGRRGSRPRGATAASCRHP